MTRLMMWCGLALAVAVLMSGCVRARYATTRVASGAVDVESARAAVKIEITTDEAGRPGEVEYHIRPDEVPEAVRAAMEAKYPGGRYIGAEREMNGGRLYFELAKEIDGLEVEAMFHADGTPHDGEIQVREADVPAAVRDAIAKGYPGGTVRAWERIEDGSGATVEYHVKLNADDKAYKVVVTTGGALTAAYLEIPAEIEVPVPLP